MPTLFWDICLSVKGVVKYNKNRTLEQNIALDWDNVSTCSHLLLNQLENDIKIWEQTDTEERESDNATVELRNSEQETTQEPCENQMQEEGDGELPTVLQNVEE